MRSYLYVPGDAPARLAKAAGRGADALIVDLEDAVPLALKENARHAVADYLRSGGSAWVRINPGEMGLLDAHEVLGSGLLGLCVAKASLESLSTLDRFLSDAERASGIAVGSTRIVPLLETAAALFDALAIARSPRTARLQLGEADLAADLGVSPGPDGRELWWARSQVVAASAAAGIDAPVAPVSTNFTDLAELRLSTIALRRMGFHGRACIHPAQLPVVHEVFTPTAEELAAAHDVLTRFAAAQAAGSAVCVDAHGRLVDEAVVRSARRVVG
ncbi:citrate lyase [Rhizocola hellebori]|uniref:Citrate lyase n=1 Tax=Rhizocola hellebori TaxID=1392758 RepID=A0A8J3Q222_9ACTN|nr:CoA ester lyase [Rhizocola hellebori]GIH02388.1 citrate lyase [Rhizocola hellebori]